MPAILESQPSYLADIAAGIGGGSQAHQNDDENSRDHGWGPSFAIWLEDRSYELFGAGLQATMDSLPTSFEGYSWRHTVRTPNPVHGVSAYLESITGFSKPPKDNVDWLRIPESYLFEITPTRLFYDKSGKITEIFRSFRYYPDDVWVKRLESALGWSAEWGQKHLKRSIRRDDRYNVQMYLNRFIESVMRSTFLINRRYAPYHKWMHREFLKLPRLSAQLDPIFERLLNDPRGAGFLIDEIFLILESALRELGFSSKPIKDAKKRQRVIREYHCQLNDFTADLKERIVDDRVRRMNRFADQTFPPSKAVSAYFSKQEIQAYMNSRLRKQHMTHGYET